MKGCYLKPIEKAVINIVEKFKEDGKKEVTKAEINNKLKYPFNLENKEEKEKFHQLLTDIQTITKKLTCLEREEKINQGEKVEIEYPDIVIRGEFIKCIEWEFYLNIKFPPVMTENEAIERGV